MPDIIAQSPRDLQTRASLLVDREIFVCVSGLIATLGAGFYHLHVGHKAAPEVIAMSDLAEQAMNLAAPVLDYENAARQAGWTHVAELDVGGFGAFHNDIDTFMAQDAHCSTAAEAWQDACSASGIDPDELEIYEHWAISGWLADKLEAKSERIDRDFAGLIVWGRTTTGQAIYMDNVIQEIISETGYASGA